ncbi:MAG: hypothetical protein C4326_07405 [Ignavibacteria bacterium]
MHAPLTRVAAFYSDLRNLAKISPPFPRLRILAEDTAVEEGKTFDIELDFIIFAMRWRSFIEQVHPGSFFVDTSQGKLLRTWRHVHRYEPVDDGTLLTDEVVCDPRWWVAPFIGIGLTAIFAFRRRAIERVLR